MSLSFLLGLVAFERYLDWIAANHRDLLTRAVCWGCAAGKQQQYVPNLQQRTQERWINSASTENQYIEFDAVSRLGIRNPKADLKKRFPKGLSLETCHVNQTVVDNVAGSVDEALATCEILDVMVLLPAPCTDQDASTLLTTIPALKRSKTTRVLCDSFVCGDDFISKCADLFKVAPPPPPPAAAPPPRRPWLRSKSRSRRRSCFGVTDGSANVKLLPGTYGEEGAGGVGGR